MALHLDIPRVVRVVLADVAVIEAVQTPDGLHILRGGN